MATIDDFNATEIKIGKIISAEKIPETDKLLCLVVDFGEENPRQVVSGIAPYFEDTETLVGICCAFATNLEPRIIKGFESQAMILGIKTEDNFSLLIPSHNVLLGSKAG
ncbi:MAG: methionine--tRNA ligase [Patescibacteria group bacterium]|nr:methionine--tRNA ligase [bacterium]MDZ4240992.1 methionine--tRNA ligase [Patescibacteria group bacterium]